MAKGRYPRTPEHRKRIAEGIRKGLDEMTEEERAMARLKRSNRRRDYWDGLTPEQRASLTQKISEGRRRAYAEMTVEERERHRQNISRGMHRSWQHRKVFGF